MRNMIEADEYEYVHVRAKRDRVHRRYEAIYKVADGEKPKCAICGCPHVEILQFGHFNADGRFHRKKIPSIIIWVLRNDIGTIKKKIQLECPYCNFWHGVYGDYPPLEKRPKWGEGSVYPHVEQTNLEMYKEK